MTYRLKFATPDGKQGTDVTKIGLQRMDQGGVVGGGSLPARGTGKQAAAAIWEREHTLGRWRPGGS